MSIESVRDLCFAALPTGVTPLVRVSLTDISMGARLLDNGAMGIIVPDVETAEQAAEIVRNYRFAPVGKRSVGASYPQLGFEGYPPNEAMRLLNENILLVAMIESSRGVENASAIAAVPGIDVLHIGSNDLLIEMGIRDQLGTEKHFAICDRVIKACRQHNKIFSIGGVRTPELQQRFIAAGARMLTTNSDVAFLMMAAKDYAKSVRLAEKSLLATKS
jgi:2-keto-3-deoxy-L-rhamnonate aldolase RhmA